MKKNYLMPTIIILLLILLAVFNLYPSFQWYLSSPQKKVELEKKAPAKFNKIKSKIVKLGLDLQGGMHLVLEVDKSKLKPEEKKTAQDRALRVILNRIDQFGVSEPHIQKEGDSRIIVELPGINHLERAKDLIGETALLEFKLVAKQEDINVNLKRLDDVIKSKILKLDDKLINNDSLGKSGNDSLVQAKADAEQIFGVKSNLDTSKTVVKSVADSLKSKFPDLNRPFSSLLARYGNDLIVTQENIATVEELLKNPVVKKAVRGSYEFVWGEENIDKSSNKKYKLLFLLKKHAELNGSVIKTATATFSSQGFSGNEPIVNLTMNSKGARRFAKITGRNLKRRLAIVLDNKVVMAPVLQSRIATGSAQISGIKDIQEAQDLAIVLQAGALPAPVKIIEERSIGATLGADSISKAKITLIASMLLVFLFIMFYYSIGGFITVISLLLNLLLVLGILAMFGFTLTLPGIAGMILTIGMAVDSNVLIFERMREEFRLGKTVRTAIESGFHKASITILDANVTTFLTGIILYYYGSGPIKGFALTLMIGIAATLFVSLVFTKLVFEWLGEKKQNLVNVGKLSILKNAKYQILKFKKIAMSISGSVIFVGLVGMVVLGFNYGVDFKGGALLQVRFSDKSVSENDIRGIISSVDKDAKSEIKKVKVDKGDFSEYIITIAKSEKSETQIKSLNAAFVKKYTKAGVNVLRQEMVGPKVGKELKNGAIVSVILALLIIILYISFRFEFWYGIGAIVALAHDVLITLGVFSLTGAEFSLSVVAALLTIVGYSLNDTIVIFDRVRENMRSKSHKVSKEEIINLSVNETLSRTVITSLTTFFTVAALFFFGPETIKGFSGALLIGVIVGTYSSVFIASPVYLYFSSRKDQKNK